MRLRVTNRLNPPKYDQLSNNTVSSAHIHSSKQGFLRSLLFRCLLGQHHQPFGFVAHLTFGACRIRPSSWKLAFWPSGGCWPLSDDRVSRGLSTVRPFHYTSRKDDAGDSSLSLLL